MINMPNYLKLLTALTVSSMLLFLGLDLIKIANRAQIITKGEYAYMIYSIVVCGLLLASVIIILLEKLKKRKKTEK